MNLIDFEAEVLYTHFYYFEIPYEMKK